MHALPHLLDSRLIRCFLAVMDTRNVTLASEVLCQTQSATSKSILKLEEEIGAPLFEREISGMVPTVYGLTLARFARQMDLESRRARAEVAALKHGGYGSLNVGAGPMWSVHLLPDVAASFHRSHPGVKVRTNAGVLDTMVPDLLKGNLDVICCAMDFPDHPDIHKEPLIDVDYIVVARNRHPLFELDIVIPEHLLDYPWVGFIDDLTANRRVTQFFITHGMESPNFAVEAPSLGAILGLVGAGDFIAGLSSTVLPHARKLGLEAVPVRASFWQFKAGVAFRQDNPHPLVNALVRQFHASLAAHA
jgi:DNA-binding transcriptional LysR family regulator